MNPQTVQELTSKRLKPYFQSNLDYVITILGTLGKICTYVPRGTPVLAKLADLYSHLRERFFVAELNQLDAVMR